MAQNMRMTRTVVTADKIIPAGARGVVTPGVWWDRSLDLNGQPVGFHAQVSVEAYPLTDSFRDDLQVYDGVEIPIDSFEVLD